MPFDDPTSTLTEGATFGARYTIARRIGAGGMAFVYEAVDAHTNRHVAVKAMTRNLAENATLRERFELESKVTAAIESDHIVEVLDAGFDAERRVPFLVMELLRGRDLAKIVQAHGGLQGEEVLLVLWQVSLALEKTHEQGIVHRDLKPENLYLTVRDDASLCVKVLDFGIAKVIEGGTPATTSQLGTPYYMAPEQITGEKHIDQRADLHALGHIAFTLFAAHPYWEQESEAGLFKILDGIKRGIRESASARARQYGATVPEGFDAWFERAVAPDVSERFDTSVELVHALAAALRLPLPQEHALPRLRACALGHELPPTPLMRPSAPASVSPKRSVIGRSAWLAAAAAVVGLALILWPNDNAGLTHAEALPVHVQQTTTTVQEAPAITVSGTIDPPVSPPEEQSPTRLVSSAAPPVPKAEPSRPKLKPPSQSKRPVTDDLLEQR